MNRDLLQLWDGIICFGGEDWWYHNRGHYDMQIMRRFALKVPVLFVNSVVMQRPRLAERKALFGKVKRKLRSIRNGIQHIENQFHVYSPLSIPLHGNSLLRFVNASILEYQVSAAAHTIGIRNPLLWIECPAACEAGFRLSHQLVVYQRTDRHEEFRSEDGGYIDAHIRRYDERLRSESECVVYVSKWLYEEEKHTCRRAFLSDHGVDFELFANAANEPSLPMELKDIKPPIVGFFGAMDDHTFDVELAAQIAAALPDISFVYVGHASCNVSPLQRLSNVRLVGQQPYKRIPHFGKHFDVAIMPWRQNRWIEACNPVKTKEYLALAKPVVSTPFRQLEQYGDLVTTAGNAQEFIKEISDAITNETPEKKIARVERVRRESWEVITGQVWAQLQSITGCGESQP